MILKMIIIFVAGLLIDLLVAKYTGFIASKRRGPAALFSMLITITNFFFLTLILKEGISNGIFNILAFAGGGGVGTFLSMKKV